MNTYFLKAWNKGFKWPSTKLPKNHLHCDLEKPQPSHLNLQYTQLIIKQTWKKKRAPRNRLANDRKQSMLKQDMRVPTGK